MGRPNLRSDVHSFRSFKNCPSGELVPRQHIAHKSCRGGLYVLFKDLYSTAGKTRGARPLELRRVSPRPYPLPTRRQFLYTGAAVAAGAAVIGTDGYFESYRLQLKKIEIPLRR